MSKSTIGKVIKTTFAASAVLGKARNKMIKSSFNTAKKIAVLYKDAGVEAFKLSKNVVKKTVELTVDNQKEMLQTSGEAIKEAAKTIRKKEARAKKMTPKRGSKKNAEVTIDDLL